MSGWSEEQKTEDDEAVERARAGDRNAYAVLVTRYSALAHRTAYLLGAGHEAEDVVQEAFVKGYRALDTFRAGSSFRPLAAADRRQRDLEPAPLVAPPLEAGAAGGAAKRDS